MSNTDIFSSMDKHKQQYTDKRTNSSEKEVAAASPGTSPDFKKGSFFDDLEDVGLFKWESTASSQTTNKSQVRVSDR